MTKEFLLSAIGDIDDDLIAEAEEVRPVRRMPVWAKISAAAACVCLCAVAVLSFPGFMKCGSMAPESANKQDAAVMDREDFSYTAEDGIMDTAVSTARPGAFFIFYKGGEASTRWQEYPDGRPSAETVFSDYLRAAGCEIACLSVVSETEGEKDEIIDYGGESVVVHTMSITTVTVTLDGIPEEDILRGLSDTVRHFGFDNVKHVYVLADGEEIWHGEW